MRRNYECMYGFENGTYKMEEIYEKDTDVNARCICYLDTYCEIKNVTISPCVISYQGTDYSLELDNKIGSIELQKDAGWLCE